MAIAVGLIWAIKTFNSAVYIVEAFNSLAAQAIGRQKKILKKS